jgi:protein gp37
MALGKTGIEYLTKLWSFYTGCKHTLKECPCADKCWARTMAKRFHKSFEPTLHEYKLFDPLHHKNPERIGVCFTGDIGGEWVDVYKKIYPERSEYQCYYTLKETVKTVMNNCPQHQFFVLTKNPEGLVKWGHWPDNCFVGTTVCNQKMFVENSIALQKIDAKNKMISFEPLIESMNGGECEGKRLGILKTLGVSFIVIGGWSKGKVQPKVKWIREIIEEADKAGIKVFLKNNLIKVLVKHRYEEPFWIDDNCSECEYQNCNSCGCHLRQELPEVN